MKHFTFPLWCLMATQVYGQPSPDRTMDLQKKYKDDKAAVLHSDIEYRFSRNNNSVVEVSENKKEKLISLRYNAAVFVSEVYDSNSRLEKFSGSSSLRQRAAEDTKNCGNYTSEGLFYDDSKFCTHELKLKELGEIWDLTVAKKITNAKYFTTLFFQEKFPVVEKKIQFYLPADLEIEIREFNFTDFSITRSEKSEGGEKTVTFTARDLPAHQNENYERGAQYNLPHLLVMVKAVVKSGTKVNLLSSTQDLYTWYRSLIQELKPNPDVFRAMVNQLLKGKQTDEEKIKSIYYWVQDNIRYIAFEDGIAGFKPHEAHHVYEQKYGDCKGMANLTKEMLKVAGYDARLSWVGTSRILYEQTIPSLAVNNHMICTVLLKDKKYYLDATEKYIPFNENAERIQNRSVMIEDGEKFILDRIPGSGPDRDKDNRIFKARITGGNLEGSCEITLNGETKKDFLHSYHYTPSDKKEDFMMSFISYGNKKVKTSNLNIRDLEERSGPLSVTCDIQFAGAASTFNDEYYIDIDPAKTYKNWIIKDTRQGDVDLGEKIHKYTRVEIDIPPGYSVAHMPEKFTLQDNDFSFSMNYSKEADKVIYTKELHIPTGIIPKKAFSRWNEAVKKLSKAYENQLTFKK